MESLLLPVADQEISSLTCQEKIDRVNSAIALKPTTEDYKAGLGQIHGNAEHIEDSKFGCKAQQHGLQDRSLSAPDLPSQIGHNRNNCYDNKSLNKIHSYTSQHIHPESGIIHHIDRYKSDKRSRTNDQTVYSLLL